MIKIQAATNADDALVLWNSDAQISGCLGFALERRRNGNKEVVDNYVGFPGDAIGHRPSTEWPFQRWKWTDHPVSSGDRVAYRVTARIGQPGALRDGPRSAWTSELVASGGAPFGAHFNPGIVASQWVANRLGHDAVANHPVELLDAIRSPGDPLRNALSGELRTALLDLLTRAEWPGYELHAVLFELSDPELMAALETLGPRAHVILANGAHDKQHPDENHAARKRLRGRIDLSDRCLTSYLAHNKFAVLTENGSPILVWTGSTNWTPTGLCTQANNALVIEDGAVALEYLDQWHRIKDAQDRFPAALRQANAAVKSSLVGLAATPTRVWFTPLANQVDLKDARAVIASAKDGILFLMFNPGTRDTLLTAIREAASVARIHGQQLYVRGVLNQDPGGRRKPVLMYDERGIVPNDLDVVLPARISDPFGRWVPELLKAPSARAMVHSKCVVIDPLGPKPVVMTGSHNLGTRASAHNDDNLVIIEGNRELALAYTVNILAIYGNYRWRENQLRAHPGSWTNLTIDDKWQGWGLHGDGALEARFWFGPSA